MTGVQPALPCRAPVIVLTAARSGSTLLRFILDSHPDLACPPETGVLSAIAELARSWNVLEAASTRRVASTAAGIALPPQVVTAIRQVIDGAYDTYLSRERKSRWCDKSLSNAMFADLFCQIYPETKFICLYRHCMDFILSAVEACPWGVTGFGFDPYVARYPGNSLAALGKYWLEQSGAISTFESKHPGSCHRVRYEDLVTNPEPVIQSMFDFIGVKRAPGISQECFGIEHASNGLGDPKIWFTDRIGTGSVGRGSRIPVRRLPEDLREEIDKALHGLGYGPPGGQWNATPERKQTPGNSGSALRHQDGHGRDEADHLSETAAEIWFRMVSAGSGTLSFIMDRWPVLDGNRMRIVIRSHSGRIEEFSWVFDPQDFCFTEHHEADPDNSIASITGDAGTWLSVLCGATNMASEVIAGRLHFRADGEHGRFQSAMLQATAMLLRLTPTPRQRTVRV